MSDYSGFVLVATIGWLIVWFGSHWSLGGAGVVISLLFGIVVVDLCGVFPSHCVDKYGASQAMWMVWAYVIAPSLICAARLCWRLRNKLNNQ